MVVCSKCGNHYNEEFLQCPQCGSTRRISEAEEKNNNSVIGFLITLVIVLAFAGLIGFGVYLFLNPVTEGPATSDLDPNLYPTETTTTTGSTTTTTISTRTTTTTTKLAGTEGQQLGNHTYTLPDGYKVFVPSQEALSAYNITATDNMTCLSSASDEYCIAYLEGTNMTLNNTNKEQVNSVLTASGYSEMISIRLYGSSYYYFYKNEGDKISGGLYKNKGSDMLFGSFAIKGDKVDEESMSTLVSIFASMK